MKELRDLKDLTIHGGHGRRLLRMTGVRCRAKRGLFNNKTRDFHLEAKARNLALTVLYLPCSLDSGTGLCGAWMMRIKNGLRRYLAHKKLLPPRTRE